MALASRAVTALDDLVHAGLVREIGCSNFSADQQLEAADAIADGAPRFVSVQNELSMLERADETDGLTGAEANGLAYIPYFPLASGPDRRTMPSTTSRRSLSAAQLRLIDRPQYLGS